MNKVLVVEDEVSVRRGLVDYLGREGFEVSEAATLAEARARPPGAQDVVILDWMLPDGQGIELLKMWRQKGVTTPAILLTARTDLVDKVLGLELGANDYMTKPFEPRELVARIRVQLRAAASSGELGVSGAPGASGGRRLEPPRELIEAGAVALDLGAREARYQSRLLELTKTEFDLLRLFVENPNQVFSREELLKQVWGYERSPTTRTVDTHVLQLRQKTEAPLFETVHKIGYRFRVQK